MKLKPKEIVRSVHPGKIILPALIGIAVAIFIFWREGAIDSLKEIRMSPEVTILLVMAAMMIVSRITGYVIRLRILSENKLSIPEAIRIVFLWEFSSAVTPSAVGGTSVALLFLYKAGLPIGKGSAIVLATLFLDELYFVLVFPLIMILVGPYNLFALTQEGSSLFDNQYFYFALAGYCVKITIVSLVGYGLFINPVAIKRFIVFLFSLPGLRKWKEGAVSSGDDIIKASHHLKNKPFRFWLKGFGATAFSWTTHYCVANFLIVGLIFGISGDTTPQLLSFVDHLNVFARQLVLWVMMMVMPTPGGTGLSEIIFMDYMGIFIPPGFSSLTTVIWRLFSYYPYLLIGAVVLPGWIKSSFLTTHTEVITDDEEDENAQKPQ